MKLLVAAGLVVHVVMRPRTKRYGISCWGWFSSDVHDTDRYYRGGLGPKEPLSYEEAGLTIGDPEPADHAE
jgi:hypothetical protein